MSLEIRLLGAPSATRDGEELGLRGNKGWLLLALLLLRPEPLSRTRLTELLFPDADDPGGALRWNLSQLRRVLGIELDGNPVEVVLPAGTRVDVLDLRQAQADAAMELPGLDRRLLAGIEGPDQVELELWLEDERRHVRQLVADLRQEAALARLGRGDTRGAVALARRVYEAAPHDENAAALLVRALRADGRIDESRRVTDEFAERLREELGVEPTQTLWAAVASPPGGERRAGGRDAVLAQLETGRSAVSAGALDAGIGALRSATVAARALGDGQLLAASLVELGSALIHGVRGVDQDGLALLHEALPLAEEHGAADLATTAMREIGYVDMLRARYDRAIHWFGRARDAAEDDRSQIGWVAAYEGAVLSDVGDVAASRDRIGEALELAADRDPRLEAFARVFVGREALLVDDLGAAVTELTSARDAARQLGWTAFLGFPEAFLADAIRRQGRIEEARQVANRALAVSEQVGDPCWESLALRSLGLVAVDEGRLDAGLGLLEEAPPRCRRLPDTYLWIEAYGLDGLAAVAVEHGLPRAETAVNELAETAAAHGMGPLRERANRYRGARA